MKQKQDVLKKLENEIMPEFISSMFVGLKKEEGVTHCCMCCDGLQGNIIEAFVACAKTQKNKKAFLEYRDILYNAVFNIMAMDIENAQDFFQMFEQFVEEDEEDSKKKNATVITPPKK